MDNNLDEYFIQEKTGYDRLLDFLVFVAVFIVTIFLILDLLAGSNKTSLDIMTINDNYLWFNIVIFFIFFADLVRLKKESKDNISFLKENWLDIIATIPFALIVKSMSSFTQVFKFTKFAKLTKASKMVRISRASKITKEFKAAGHLKKESDKYKNKHRL